jgi:hypothetical protein
LDATRGKVAQSLNPNYFGHATGTRGVQIGMLLGIPPGDEMGMEIAQMIGHRSGLMSATGFIPEGVTDE